MGKKKKPKIEVTEYYLSEHFGISIGPLDALLGLIVKEKSAWTGIKSAIGTISINLPELFGGVKKEGGLRGTVQYLPGEADQLMPDSLAQKLGRADGNDCPGFRGIASIFFYGGSPAGFYWTANTPYLPGVWAKVRRILKKSDGSEQWYPSKAVIGIDPTEQSVATSTATGTTSTPIPFESELVDSFGSHDNATNNERQTIIESGLYRLSANYKADSALQGYGIFRDGAKFLGTPAQKCATAGDRRATINSGPIVATAGEYYTVDRISGGVSIFQTGQWFALERLDASLVYGLVKRTSTILGIGTGDLVITWQALEDGDAGTWNISNPTRIVAPTAGRVRVIGNIRLESAGIGVRTLHTSFNKDGLSSEVGLPFNTSTGGPNISYNNPVSAVMEVSADDYFEFIVNSNNGDAPDITDLDLLWASIEYIPASTKVCVVYRSLNQAISSGVPTVVQWNATEIDDDNMHSNTVEPSKIIAPAGATHVRLSFNIRSTSGAANYCSAYVTKNGAYEVPLPDIREGSNQSGQNAGVNAMSTWVQCSQGDEFELVITPNDNINVGVGNNWFCAEFKTIVGNVDMNPAHIIHDSLTDDNWGMGTPLAALNDTAFKAAADTLFDENFGISILWSRQTSIENFIQEILDHIQGVLYADPATGLLTLSLIRGDYTPASLDTLTPDNADLISFSRKLWGDIVNEIIVTWTNPENEQEETVTVQDDSSIATQGGIVSDSRNYYGVRNAVLAQSLAWRDLRSAGQPLAAIEVEVDRSFWTYRPASVIKVTWPEYSITDLVMRVQSIDYGKIGDPTIKMSLIEDVYGLDIGTFDDPPSTAWVDPSAAPDAMDETEILTLPYLFAVNTTVADFIDTPEYPEVLAGVLSTTDNEDAFEYELWDEITLANGSTDWQSLTINNIIGRGELAAALDREASTLDVSFVNVIGLTSPVVAGFAIIGGDGEAGNEIVMIDDDTGDVYDLIRGVLDTVPRAWPAGTKVWFVDESTVFEDILVRSSGEVVDYKLLMRTSLDLFALASASLESATLSDRPWLPNRPANVTAYGESWSSQSAPIDARDRPDPWVTVTFAIRNRLDEDSQVLAWTDAGQTAETGQTTTIEVRALDGTLLATHDSISAETYNVPNASFGSEQIVEIRVFSERSDADGDFVSLQYFSHWVQVDSATFDSTYFTFDSSTVTMDQA